MVYYEHPINNKLRVWLRFSRLYERLENAMQSDTDDWSMFAFQSLFELLELTEMNDIRGELLMELERFQQFLQTLIDSPDIDKEACQKQIDQAGRASMDLRASPARPAHVLCANPWVSLVRTRMHVPGGCNEFDVPSLHWWKSRPSARQRNDLEQFLQLYTPYYLATSVLLESIRQSADTEVFSMTAGAITLNLNHQRPIVLIRIELPDDCQYFPEISASRHIVNIRMMKFGDGNWEVNKINDSGRITLYQCSMPSVVSG